MALPNVMKDENAAAEQMQEQKLNIINDPKSNHLVSKFTQLWSACYFERRLTRQKVEQIDLNEIVKDLIQYYTSQDVKIDFRRVVPLLQGLHVLFNRKVMYLVRDADNLKKNMSDPLDSINLDDKQGQRGQQINTKKKAPNQNGPRYQVNNPALQLNPNNFDWFLSGIDQNRLEGILGATAKNCATEFNENAHGSMKLEETYLMVRDAGPGNLDDPLNDISGGMNLLPEIDQMAEGPSAFREVPGEAEGFE